MPVSADAILEDAQGRPALRFARLSQDGTVLMPLDRYPFSERFGWVTDRFGVPWQITVA
jgi:uncharacterized glyoxalase superfamily protein PhnB